MHALVGENGAGKSTMIKILGGVIKPDAGTLRIDGEDVTRRRRGSGTPRTGVGTVFQELTLLPWMTVAENLFVGARAARREPPDPAAQARDPAQTRCSRGSASTGSTRTRSPASLSLAQRQILEIARAF